MTPPPNYDLFVSYADADRAWVEGYLLDALQQAGVRYISESAFALGVPRIIESERAIKQSQRTLLVLSPAYLTDTFGQFADLLAQSYGLETDTWPVIPLILKPVTLPSRLSMLTVLDAVDSNHWPMVLERLCTELRRAMPQPAPKPLCPYPGMVPFSAEDARFFYGRKAEIDKMLRHLRHQRLLFVIGPSGSGKSSLVHAGLLPHIVTSSLFPKDFWLVRKMRPGSQPYQALTRLIGADLRQLFEEIAGLLATHAPAQRLLLVIDQFEELFTQVGRDEQQRFIDALNTLRGLESCALLLVMRADFYSDLMNSNLWPINFSQRLELTPLRGSVLRQAIEQPANDVGVRLEPELVQRLLADAADEPGALPLIQETMILLWDAMVGHLLPLSTYMRLGGEGHSGLATAIATKADATMAALSPEQQTITRRILLRLIQFGAGRPDTRRRQSVTRLRSVDDDPLRFDATLQHLTDNRLLMLSSEESATDRTVDIAHEALISDWPVLRQWLATWCEAERLRRRLEAKAVEWVRLGRSIGGLLDEVELPEAEQWLASLEATILGYSEVSRMLVQASQAARVDEVKRHCRAHANELAAQSQGALSQYPQRSLLLAVEAITVSTSIGERSTPAAENALQRGLTFTGGISLRGHEQSIIITAVSPDSRWLVTGSADATVRLWDLTDSDTSNSSNVLPGHGSYINAVVFSPDGRWLVTGDTSGVKQSAVHLWNLTSPNPASTGRIISSSHTGPVSAFAISADGHWLVTASRDHTARLWDLRTENPPDASIVLCGHTGAITAVAISPDNRWLITASADRTVRIWDLTAKESSATPHILSDLEDHISVIAVSSDSRWLVTNGVEAHSRHTRLWNLADKDLNESSAILRGNDEVLDSTSFGAISADGHWLVTVGWRTVYVWDLTAKDPAATPQTLTGHEGEIITVAISPDNHWLVTGSADRTVRLWDLTAKDPMTRTKVLRGHHDSITGVTISPDSHWLITSCGWRVSISRVFAGGDSEPTARLWDLTANDPAATPHLLGGHEGGITAVVISPNNHWLVTGSTDCTARLWDLTIAPDLTNLPVVLRGHTSSVKTVAISVDNHWLVTQDGYDVRLWNLMVENTATAQCVLHDSSRPLHSFVLSPDSRWLAVDWMAANNMDSITRLWDLTVPTSTTASVSLRGQFLAMSHDSNWLVTNSFDGMIYVWDVTLKDPSIDARVLKAHIEPVCAAVLSPDSRWLAVGSENAAYLWNLTNKNSIVAPTILHGHKGFVTALAISHDSHWLITGRGGCTNFFGDILIRKGDNTVRLWDLTHQDPTATPILLHGHTDYISSLAISSDSHWLVTGSGDHTIRLWDLTVRNPTATSRILAEYEDRIEKVAISPDNHWLVALGSGVVRLWNLTAVDPCAFSIILRGHDRGIAAIIFSADSHWLVTAGYDQTVRLWDLTERDPSTAFRIFPSYEGSIRSLAMSSDNHWLITGGQDQVVRVWNLRINELIGLACRTAGRNLTMEEWRHYMGDAPYHRICPNLPPGEGAGPDAP